MRTNLHYFTLVDDNAFIRKNIPSGQEVRSSLHEDLKTMNGFVAQSVGMPELADTGRFKNEIRNLCERQGHNPERIFASLGTLGGGNHFLEVDMDENYNRWVLIHSGSRILGTYTAEYHETLALRETDADSPIKYLSGKSADHYLGLLIKATGHE